MMGGETEAENRTIIQVKFMAISEEIRRAGTYVKAIEWYWYIYLHICILIQFPLALFGGKNQN